MGNLKKMFYKDYYEGVEYSSSTIVKERNARRFRQKNEDIITYSPDLASGSFGVLETAKYRQPNHVSFKLMTTNPGLIIGTGYKHEMHTEEEFKLGFFFDHTTGLPILPGSSIKGVLRSAFPTASSNLFGSLELTEKQKQRARFIQSLLPSLRDKQDAELFKLVHQLELAIFAGVDIKTSLGDEKKKIHKVKISNRCIFFDARILAKAPKGRIVGSDVLTPHGDNPLRNPTPLPFLKVLPDVTFEFAFSLPTIEVGDWKLTQEELKDLFQNILMILGMGAKTNVGYGQFTDEVPLAVKKAQNEDKQRDRPQAIVPKNISRNTQLEMAILVAIVEDVCVFQFNYDGAEFQFVKATSNITKKWLKKGYEGKPIEGNTYRIVLQSDIIIGQKNPNFSISKPKENE